MQQVKIYFKIKHCSIITLPWHWDSNSEQWVCWKASRPLGHCIGLLRSICFMNLAMANIVLSGNGAVYRSMNGGDGQISPLCHLLDVAFDETNCCHGILTWPSSPRRRTDRRAGGRRADARPRCRPTIRRANNGHRLWWTSAAGPYGGPAATGDKPVA